MAPKLFTRTPPTKTDPDVPESDRRIAQLEARRVADTLEIIALEKAGGKIEPADPRETEMASRVARLLGEDHPKQPNSKSLADLYADREAIDRALAIARQRSVAEHAQIVNRRCAERLPQWRDLVRRRTLAVAMLRRLNAETDQFIADLASGGLRGGMPCEFPAAKLLGHSNTGSPAREFLEAAVAAGIITEREISNA
jgi:hypothetical protein